MSTFTPDSELELLFDPAAIPASFKQSLPDDLHVRYNTKKRPFLLTLTSKPSFRVDPAVSLNRRHPLPLQSPHRPLPLPYPFPDQLRKAL